MKSGRSNGQRGRNNMRQGRNKVNAEDIIRYCRQFDVSALSSLPPVHDWCKNYSIKTTQEAAAALFEFWFNLLHIQKNSIKELETGDLDGKGLKFYGEEALELTLVVVSAYYHDTVMNLFRRTGLTADPVPAGVDPERLWALGDRFAGKPIQTLVQTASFATFEYFSCVSFSLLLILYKANGIRPSFTARLEHMLHEAVFRLLDASKESSEIRVGKIIREFLLDGCFELMRLAYVIPTQEPIFPADGPRLIDLRLEELGLLAQADHYAVERYGKKIPRQFEKQLSLLMQSLGYFVVSADPGERLPDLICIPPSNFGVGAIMVDAKSSKEPYELPTSDERAFVEYVSNARTAYSVLPPVEALVIVGGKPASGLSTRLLSLERKVGLPVRFCQAEDLAHFRERLIGSLPIQDFTQAIKSAKQIVSVEDLNKIIVELATQHRALESYAKAVLSRRVK